MGFNDIGEVFQGSNGHSIVKYSVRNFNRKILKDVVESSFKCKLGDNYFSLVLQDNSIIYIEMKYKGLEVVVPNPGNGIPPHIRTLAVLPQHIRNGVGRDLVEAVSEDHHKFNLRTLKENEKAIEFYSELIGKGVPFKAKNGMNFEGFFENHSTQEQTSALEYMARQPYFFDNKKS